MLSKALTTTSKPSQKLSSKVPSVVGATRSWSAVALSCGFIFDTASTAELDFEWPTLWLRKRNWRDRFDFSMMSSSVTVSLPPAPHATPISARFLRNSQPSAPDPTRKTLSAASFWTNGAPKTAA